MNLETLLFVSIVLTLVLVTQSAIPGPPEVTFRDDNGTLVKVDFSDIEFYPVETFPLLTVTKLNSSGLFPLSDAREKDIVETMVDAFKQDIVTETKPGKIVYANYINELVKKYPRIDLSSYGINLLGTEVLMQKKFNKYAIQANFSPDPEHSVTYALVRIQHRCTFGRKVIRFAFWQSMNKGNPRTIWLTDDIMWRGVMLKPVGRVHTPNGWAIMWTE